MRILHTADWHIGQTLSGFGRESEHRAFLEALADLIVDEQVDALLVAGDVFDGINPSGDAQRLLYSAIASFLRRRPGLTIVMIAGNHDPAARLVSPKRGRTLPRVAQAGTMGRAATALAALVEATNSPIEVEDIELRNPTLEGEAR